MSNFVPEGLRRQRDYLTQQANMQQPCWACGAPSSEYEASGDAAAYEPWRASDENAFTCPHCTAPMRRSVPFVAVGPVHWFWSRPKNVTATGFVVNSENGQ